jgi:arylsulfatase A-like enzyme
VAAQRPNIVVILLDDLGKEWISCYGADKIHTPNIDQLAAEGMKFENAYSMPQCTPSRITLMTGQYPNRHGWVNHWDVPRWGRQAHFDHTKYPTIGNVMKSAGYVTCAVGKWQVDDFRVEPDAMKNAGYDAWCMWTGYEKGNSKASGERYWDPYIFKDGVSKTYKGKFGPDLYAQYVFDFIEEKKARPFFVYWAMALPHSPLVTTPLKPKAKSSMDKHIAMVEYVDHLLMQLRENLEKSDVAENTLILFTTDNGTGKNITGSRHGVRVPGGKTSIRESGVNAPFIVYWKDKVKAGSVSEALVDFTDILPTCAKLGGAEVDPQTIDGRSFVDVLLGATKDGGRKWVMGVGAKPARFEDGRVKPLDTFRERALRNEQWKVTVNFDKEISGLYDLKNDPFEKTNLLNTANPDQEEVLRFFQEIVDGQPDIDAAPQYEPNPIQAWDKTERTRNRSLQ